MFKAKPQLHPLLQIFLPSVRVSREVHSSGAIWSPSFSPSVHCPFGYRHGFTEVL